MNPRKPLTESQKNFMKGTDEKQAPPVQKSEPQSSKASQPTVDSSLAALLQPKPQKEETKRFNADIPKSLDDRLQKLADDTGKSKAEIARILLSEGLSQLRY